MSNAERAAKLSASLAKGFGEEFTFTPRTVSGDDVNLPKVLDPTRIVFTACGVYAGGTKERNLGAHGHAENLAQPVVVSAPRASFEIAALPWLPMEGDLCLREETKDTFAVGRALPDGFGRILVYFTAKKR